MKFIILFSLHLGSLWASKLTGSNSPYEQYESLDEPLGLNPEIGLLLKQGLKIGYLPESYVNGEYSQCILPYLNVKHYFSDKLFMDRKTWNENNHEFRHMGWLKF